MSDFFINISYIIASVLFILGIKMLGSPATARRGNLISAFGMLLAVIVTLLRSGLGYQWIVAGLALGSAIGAIAAYRVPMTAMPEMVALFNGFGGIASLLVGWAEFSRSGSTGLGQRTAIFLAILIGGITFTGSMIAYGKLSEKLSSKPWLFLGQGMINAALMLVALGAGAVMVIGLGPAAAPTWALWSVIGISLILGVLAVVPIGGGDMPVVISLLNSYSGLAACAAGFIISNTVLIVAGALVGASGLILTNIMCKAMNRSLTNVLFSGFGAGAVVGEGAEVHGEAKSISAEDAYFALEAARKVLFVPGYGMAVAQAQHSVRELANILRENGAEVHFGIHPVAGRMPGHMNVLLAEANVDYDLLVEPQNVNPSMETVDVCVVIGANDVVNPAARDDASSPIFGMPIIEVDRARTVFVLKRSMRSGFAGIENPLFFKENTRMLFGDAKESINKVAEQFK
ncbi:NAD(P)(+) transhydrogenase (Re/Si-specific) subunit beta [Treponema sp.]